MNHVTRRNHVIIVCKIAVLKVDLIRQLRVRLYQETVCPELSIVNSYLDSNIELHIKRIE